MPPKTTTRAPPKKPAAGQSKPPPAKALSVKPDPAASERARKVLRDLGEELHGAHWIGPTARDLGITHRLLAGFESGKSHFHLEGPIYADLLDLVESHRAAVARIRARRPAK